MKRVKMTQSSGASRRENANPYPQRRSRLNREMPPPYSKIATPGPSRVVAVAVRVMPRRYRRSQWQLLAGLLRDDVGGVPVRPVFIVPAAVPLLVLAVRGGRAPQRARKIGRRGECRVADHAAGQSCGDLLKQPAVAVGIAERGERAVAAVLGIRAANAFPPEQIRLVRAGVHVAGAMKDVADLNA